MALTPKQELFAREFLTDLNATQAAIRAGYSRKTAYAQGSRLLNNAEVSAFLAANHQPRIEKLSRDADGVVANLWRMAHLDPRKVAKWGVREMVEEVTEGKKKTKRKITVPYCDVVSSDEMDDDTALAITGVKMGANGIELRFADKHAATATLGRHFGLFEKDRADTNVHVTFQIDGATAPGYEG